MIGRIVARIRLRVIFIAVGLITASLMGKPLPFDIPAEPASEALLAFSRQAGTDVLFSFDALKAISSPGVTGTFEPDAAADRILAGTGYVARRNWRGKLVVAAAPIPGVIRGRFLASSGNSVAPIEISLPALRRQVRADTSGAFAFEDLPPGRYRLVVEAPGFRTVEVTNLHVRAGVTLTLADQVLPAADGLVRLDPFVVEAKSGPAVDGVAVGVTRMAAGNLDLPRTENDPLPFRVFDRTDILRSGQVNLNEYLQRELLDGDASAVPPERNGQLATYQSGSSNLSLRGFGSDETVVLVNGRRLPEVLTVLGAVDPNSPQLPDINLVPLGLVQKIEVLPVSASSLYAGNPVGGVINIILRKDVTDTEVTATYSNALRGFNAPQSSISLQHGRSLLDGKVQLLLNATFTDILPPTEAQLNYRHGVVPAAAFPVYAATPNVRSAISGAPLFGPGSAAFTSVAPGSDGLGGLAAFAGREGLVDDALYNPPGNMAASPASSDSPYGRKEQRAAYFGSVVADVFPWLQLGLDGFYSQTVSTRGFDVLNVDLPVSATSPVNPFGQDVIVSLNDTAPALGKNYSEARVDSYAVIASGLLKLPSEWRIALDAQYGRNITRYRGLAGVDPGRWAALADAGTYNPFRDTQVFAPPAVFYDQVLEFYGRRGQFVTLGDYDTLDTAVRVTDQSLHFPTGDAVVNVGVDYRAVHLADATEILSYGDGTEVAVPTRYAGRTLERYSVFGEVQAPVWPTRRLPRWLKHLDGDLALRYVAAASSNESNFAPTAAFKADFGGGWSLRGSVTAASRFPAPTLAQVVSSGPGGGVVDLQYIVDPRRGNESVPVQIQTPVNPLLHAEDALTQTGGVIFQPGGAHHLRLSLDFVDTYKTNELNSPGAQGIVDLENYFPDRVIRANPTAGQIVGPITSVVVGEVNLASRHSQDWNLSANYTWSSVFGGTIDVYARMLYFQRYDLQLFPNSPKVDELSHPDGLVPNILRFRSNFGASWSTPKLSLGWDGRYYHSRVLPLAEQAAQGARQIEPYWEFDGYVQSDLTRFLRGRSPHFGLRGQLRVDNLFGSRFPNYASGPSGVEPYGDWRGRTYSLSVTATY